MDHQADSKAAASDFLAGGGETGALMRAKNWADTPLGPADAWPQSLKTVIRILLTSRYSMWMAWGKELSFFHNDAYRPTLGVKQARALGSSARDVWKEIWPDIGPRIEHVLKTGEATWDEGLLLLLERSGYTEETYHTFSYSPLANDQGEIAGMLCVVTEETERVIGERRLRVLRELAAGIATTRTSAEVLGAVESCLRTSRHDMPFALTYLVEENDRTARLVCNSGLTRGHGAAPLAVTLAAGSTLWPIHEVLTRLTPVIVDLRDPALALPHEPWDKAPQQAVILPIMQHAQTRATGVFVAGINPYRAFDVAYRGFIDLVAGLIAGGLANARAYEAECRRAEALAEIDRAKTAFFSNASHEFRTPLTLVISPLKDLLVRSAGADHIVADKHEVELIHRNCLRLLKLVNTLLDFSRIEAGRVQALYEPVDLAAYTVELASAFRSAMDQAGLDFVVDCPPLPEPVYVDRDMWEKIVLNLVSNAFKYTLEGKVVVALRLAADARMVKLIVRDTGIGIPEAEMPRLFERFHRVAGQGGRTQEGTGIGLALVQELARLHGGTVQVQSALARGTIFTISIPLGKAHLPADRIDGARTVPPTGVRAEAFVEEALRWLPGAENAREIVVERELISPHPERPSSSASRQLVLLADDNADMRDYVCRLLGTHYDIEPVADGQAALEAARRRRPDLVLSDVMMPGLDGFGLLHALRADPQLRELPVILLSARAGEEAKVEGLEAGADDYLVKPFSARELLARIATNLETAHIRGEAAAELRHLNETLEQRVTTEIKERLRLEDAFRQAQKMEAIGQLTGGIAHDFNNLLQIIIGNVEALRRRARRDIPQGDEEFRRFIDAVARGADRAAMLTQQLLAFSRRQPLTPRLIDVNKLVTGMSELLRRTLGESIRIETILAGGMWRISADENQLENAILNLAVNARDAMPSGGRLMIETANAQLDDSYADAQDEIRAGDYAMIAVTDTGIGMSKDVVTNAFDPFFTTKEVGQGTGLGLSQVYGFLKQSGGHVKIYSEPGVGTTVKLFLPRVVTGDIVTDEVPDVRRIPTGSKSELVLVVEDDPDVRTYSTDMLRELGYGVLQAADGRTALRVLEIEAGIRLLFTDVGLPGGLNGRQLAAEGRRRLPRLKVLFTTGYAGSALVHDDKLDANVELITKPFTYAVLAAKVRELLDKSQLVS